MLALNCLLLYRKHVIKDPKALASIVSMCELRTVFLSNITPRYFTLFANVIFRPFNVRRESGVSPLLFIQP
jgi:hypothetical protein